MFISKSECTEVSLVIWLMITHWVHFQCSPLKIHSNSGFCLQSIQFCVSMTSPSCLKWKAPSSRHPNGPSLEKWSSLTSPPPFRCSLAPVLSLDVSPMGEQQKFLMIPFWSPPLWFGWAASADDKWLCHGGTCWESERFIPASVSQALFFPGAFPTFL